MKTFKIFLMVCLLFGLLSFPVSGGATSFDSGAWDSSAETLREYGIVRGDQSGDLRLEDHSTRAELITILVRAINQEETAKLLMETASFTDTADHWASGYIAFAKQNGLTTGYPDGTFRPDAEVTVAETITFLTKLLDIESTSGLTWPLDNLDAAVEAGLISADELSFYTANANEKVDRGLAFYLSDTAFSTYILSNGKTIYQTYIDTDPPTLIVDPGYPDQTTQDTVVLTGTVNDYDSLTINSVPLNVDQGQWTASVSLEEGINHFVITAVDSVGNLTSKTVTIERIPAIQSIIIEPSSARILPGKSFTFKAKVLGLDDKELTDVSVTWSASGGYIDNNGKFTADEVGTYTITATAGDKSTSAKVKVYPRPRTVETLSLAPIADRTNAEGDTVHFTLPATIPSNSSVTFQANGLPSGLTLDNMSGIISGTLGYDEAGSYSVTAAVYESGGNSVSRSFTWTITDTDTTPTLATIPNQTGTVGMYVELDLSTYANDADGDTLMFEAIGLPPGLFINGMGLISGSYNAAGTYDVQIIVTDTTPSSVSSLDQARGTFTWIVNP